jgi:AraC-like DNA-binding protein
MRTQLNGSSRHSSYLCRLRRDIARDLHAGDRIPALTREFNRTTETVSTHTANGSIETREMPEINAAVLERDPRLRRVSDLVKEHYNEPLPLHRAAQAAHLETSYFSRYFHDKTGVTFLRWLSWYRVQQTISQIEQTKCTVTCAALECGFSDVRSCQRAFLRHTGKTAAEIKRLANRQVHRNSGIYGIALPFAQWLSDCAEFCLPEITQAAACFV